MKNSWIRVGAYAGLLAALAFPLFRFVPLPTPAVVWLVTVFGVGISISAVGLYLLLAMEHKTVSLQIGAGAHVMAGVMVLCMLIVQLSVNTMIQGLLTDPPIGTTKEQVMMVYDVIGHVQLGFDIVWDVYLCLGTILIAWNMRTHPRFGLPFFLSGMIIAVPLFVLNMATFPTPPGEAELIDLGPLIGVWYLFVAIQMIRSFRWVVGRTSGVPHLASDAD